MNRFSKFQTACSACGGTTTKKHAREHNGLCAPCFNPSRREAAEEAAEARNARLIDSGYMAYAREEGHFDGPDY